MRKLDTILLAIVCYLATAIVAVSAQTNIIPGVIAESAPKLSKFYTDAGLSLRTPNFDHGTYGYFLGVGYQVNKYWAADVRIDHEDLDVTGRGVQGIGPRVVARLPFEFLSPYTFLGGRYDLEHSDWSLQAGAGIEVGVSKKLKGITTFFEGGLDAALTQDRHYGFLFGAGLRLRF